MPLELLSIECSHGKLTHPITTPFLCQLWSYGSVAFNCKAPFRDQVSLANELLQCLHSL